MIYLGNKLGSMYCSFTINGQIFYVIKKKLYEFINNENVVYNIVTMFIYTCIYY